MNKSKIYTHIKHIQTGTHIQVNHLSNQLPRSTQPCIPPGSLNRVPALAGVKAGMSSLPGGR